MDSASHDLNGERFGEWLRQFRTGRRLSVSGAAKEAGLSRSTLLRWETGTHLPRLPELGGFLQAFAATESQREEAMVRIGAPRAAHALKRDASKTTGGVTPFVSGGDLLRAMRLRRGLTLEGLAAGMGVTKGVISRWESADAAFPLDRLGDLTDLLGAHPQECAALAEAQLLLPAAPVPLSPPRFEEVDRAIVGMELHLKRHPDDPLIDLQYLSLKARIWPLAHRHPRIKDHFAHSNVSYANYLLAQGRYPEARRAAGQALEIGQGGLSPDVWWVWAVQYLAHATAQMESKASSLRAVEIMNLWDELPEALPHFNGAIDVYFRRHKALYLSRAGRVDAALETVRSAKKTAFYKLYPDELHGCGFYEGLILLRAGRSSEAMRVLPLPRVLWVDTNEPGEVLKEQLVRAEALLAVEDRCEAQIWLSESQSLLAAHNLEPLRKRWESLVDRYNESERGFRIGRHLAGQVSRSQIATGSPNGRPSELSTETPPCVQSHGASPPPRAEPPGYPFKPR